MTAVIIIFMILDAIVCIRAIFKLHSLQKDVVEIEKIVDVASKKDPLENDFMNQWVDLDD